MHINIMIIRILQISWVYRVISVEKHEVFTIYIG